MSWDLGSGGASASLQTAYNAGPPIATTTALGPVALSGTQANDGDVLTVNKSPAAAHSGNAIGVTCGANALSPGVAINHAGTGANVRAMSVNMSAPGANALAALFTGASISCPDALGVNAERFGAGASAPAVQAAAFGNTATASGTGGSAFGYHASAAGNLSSAFGDQALANADSSCAFGLGASVLVSATSGSMALGHGATVDLSAAGGGGVAIGGSALIGTAGLAARCVVIGVAASCASSSDCVVVGDGSVAGAVGQTLLGSSITTTTGAHTTCVGFATEGDNSTASVYLGWNAHATVAGIANATVVGANATGGASGAVAVGEAASVLGTDGVALGLGARVDAGHTGSAALGRDALTTAAAQFTIGSDTHPITEIGFGNGASSAAPPAVATLHGSDAAAGSGASGSSLNLRGGTKDGAGVDGNVGVRNATPKSTLDSTGSTGEGSIAAKAADFTFDVTMRTLLVDATAGAVTGTLPAAASCPRRVYDVKKVDASANAVIIKGAGAELIDAANTLSNTTQYASFSIKSDGVQWWVL